MHNHKKKANIVQVAESVYHAKAHTRETGLRHIGIHLLQKSIVVKKHQPGQNVRPDLWLLFWGTHHQILSVKHSIISLQNAIWKNSDRAQNANHCKSVEWLTHAQKTILQLFICLYNQFAHHATKSATKLRQRPRQVQAGGAGHGLESARRRRRTKSDSVRRHFLDCVRRRRRTNSSWAPRDRVRCHFWTVSGAIF